MRRTRNLKMPSPTCMLDSANHEVTNITKVAWLKTEALGFVSFVFSWFAVVSMSRELSYLEAIREALVEEMRRDAKVFVLGEDVGAYGGAFGVTQGLYDEFGESRVLDTPISESAIVGISIGASLRGYRPVAEMQFADFISCAFDQIVNQAATLRYRYGGRASVPIVIRAPSGGNVGGGLYHSQNPEAWFVHRAGLKVVAPATACDAKGLPEGGYSRRQSRRVL